MHSILGFFVVGCMRSIFVCDKVEVPDYVTSPNSDTYFLPQSGLLNTLA